MAHQFDEIIIIYNPKSTGKSKQNVAQLQTELRQKLPNTTVMLRATKRPGHATAIGTDYAKRDPNALLVSASGDGGYNELVNGVLSHPTTQLTVVVLPSGNANDHHYATSGSDIVTRIIKGSRRRIDILHIQAQIRGKEWQRYAHSYIGFGLTAYIGQKLTKADLNAINEKWLTLKYLLKFDHITIRRDPQQRWRHYSSIIIGNIDRMSKTIRLGNRSRPGDGKCELYELRQRSFFRLIGTLITSSTIGMRPTKRIRHYSLISKRALPVQCDGEAAMLDAGQTIKVTLVPGALQTLAP